MLIAEYESRTDVIRAILGEETLKMSNQELATAERLLIRILEKAAGPLGMREVLDNLPNEDATVSTLAMRSAVWQLVDKGLVRFTPDNRIILAAGNAEALRA